MSATLLARDGFGVKPEITMASALAGGAWPKLQASSSKRQATSLPQSGGKKNYEKENK